MKSILGKIAVIVFVGSGPALGGESSIIVQSTTSTANSGLYDHILPTFQDDTGIRVNIVAVGTGHAIKNARN